MPTPAESRRNFPQDPGVGGNYPEAMTNRATGTDDENSPIDWAAALSEHGAWLRVVILGRVGDRHSAEEVMQDVAMAAVAQKSPLIDRAKLGPWLHRLAVRQSLMYRRGRGRRRDLLARHAGRTDDRTPEADPLDWLVRDERSRLIREALERMPRRDAEILRLKYLDDWTYRDLADRLGLTPSAVEARLHRARARLRAELSSCRVIEVRE